MIQGRIISTVLFACLMAASGSAWSLNFDSDVPANIKQQFLDDLNFMKTVKLTQSSPLQAKIFGATGGVQYQTYFETRVDDVGMNSCGNGNAVACVIPWFANKMWLTTNFVKFSHPQIARLMVVFHEARHTEYSNNNWPHANCPNPFRDAAGKDYASIWTGAKLAGEPACDSTSEGAYASTVVMLKNIQKFCGSCTEKVKMDAGMYADDQFNRVIDSSSISKLKNDVMN